VFREVLYSKASKGLANISLAGGYVLGILAEVCGFFAVLRIILLNIEDTSGLTKKELDRSRIG
jgi:hypothetical protein